MMTRKRWLIIVAALLCFSGCIVVFPCLAKIRDGEGWQWSANNLHQIGLALHSYHEAYGQLPPAIKHGKYGKPLYSWRVLLLPFLEEQNLFNQFKLDEPWDSPHNQTLLEKIPRCYRLMTVQEPPGQTHYQVFVGPGTAFERENMTWDDFQDGLLVVEATNLVPWTAPIDLVYSPGESLPPLGGIFKKPVHLWCYEISRRAGFNACFTDGKVRFIRSDVDERNLRSLITRNGGEKVDLSNLE
jgi:hypothetical protein